MTTTALVCVLGGVASALVLNPAAVSIQRPLLPPAAAFCSKPSPVGTTLPCRRSRAPPLQEMARLVFALAALLLAGQGCAPVEGTTTVAEERRLETTESPAPSTSEPVSAAPCASGPGPMIVLGAALCLGARR
ncbi:unnamed protein product [Prorocentrum cordatum]|uniref:Uncharacterized protein n=1 Tax=Prorocentrum cordatum TaxID=2364126 RepID=A0ABN9TDI8_9DINO|nr:unnamed protein product [Polarella glacialis]